MSRQLRQSVEASRRRQRLTLRRTMELQTQGLDKRAAAAQAIHEVSGVPLDVCQRQVELWAQEGTARMAKAVAPPAEVMP